MLTWKKGKEEDEQRNLQVAVVGAKDEGRAALKLKLG
jgi:hypothetical protein